MKNQAGRRHPGVAWLLAFFILHSSFCLPAPGAVVRYYIMDQSGTNVLRTSVRFTSLTNPQLGQNTNYLGLRDFALANTNAPLDVTLHSGRWRVTVGPLSWVNSIPDTNGLILASSWPDLTWSNALPGALVAGSNVVVYVTNGVYVVNSTAIGGGGSGNAGMISNYSGGSYVVARANNALQGIVFEDQSGEQAHYVVRSGGSQDSYWWNPDLEFRWLKFSSHDPGIGVLLNNEWIQFVYDPTEDTNNVTFSNANLHVQGPVSSQTGFVGNGVGLSNTPVNIWAANPKLSYGAVVDGGTDDTVALSNAVRAVSATNGSVYIPSGTTYLANSFDATNAVSWWFAPGAKVSVADGKTLNIRGDVVASPTQWLFDGYGRTYFRTNTRLARVWVDWFGADNRGAVESSTNIQRAIDAARFTRNEAYDRLGQGTFITGIKNQFGAHTPATRPLAFSPGGSFYFITNTLVSQEIWHGKYEGNQATIVGLSSNNNQSAMWTFNDCRYTIIEDLEFKAYEGAGWRFGLVFSNINTVETQVTPFENYLTRLKFYGHRDGWLYCLGIGFGNDANNEAFTVDTCDFHDYARGGAVINNSQSFAIKFRDCSFSGGSRGWFGVTSWDPEFAPNGSGTYFIQGGTGGAHLIADFCATGLRPYEFTFNSEESFLAVTARFFPVHTNQFAFQADGLNFYGTNNLVAGWCLSTSTLVTTAYTNDYSSYANKWVYEWLVSTGGVHRIAVNAPSTALSELDQHIVGRPYNPSTASGTLFNVVKVGPNGVTNSFTTRGQMIPLNNSATPWRLANYNFSSSVTAKDGAVLRSGTRRPITVESSRFNTDRPATFEVYGGSQSSVNEDGTITIEGSNFQMSDSVVPVPTMNQRILIGRGDSSYDTNGVGGIDVRIDTANNVAASVNIFSNSVERVRQRVQHDIYGSESYLGVGGLGYFGLVGDGATVTNSSGYGIVFSNAIAAGNLIGTFNALDTALSGKLSANSVDFGALAIGSGSITGFVARTSDDLAMLTLDGSALQSLNGSAISTGTVDPARLGSGSSIATKYLRGDSTWQTISGGGDALTSGTLAQFAATTSAQLRGILSDETGGGEAMFDFGFQADGTNWFRDRTIFTNSAAADSFSAIWRADLGVWRLTNAAAANTYTDIGAGTITNSGTTDAIVYANSEGRLQEATTANVLAHFTGTPTGSKFLRDDGSWQAVTATPGGSDTQVQYNDGGSLGGDAGMVYNDTTDNLTLNGSLTALGALGFALDIQGTAQFSAKVDFRSSLVTNAHVIAAQDHNSGTASNLTVKAGAATSGTGGSLNLQGGTVTTGTAGSVNITAGSATTGTAGAVNITAGALPASPATGGTVGHVTISGGGGNADKRGGNIYLEPGLGDGGGGGTNVIGRTTGDTYNRLVGHSQADALVASKLTVNGVETNSTLTSGLIQADANGARSASYTLTSDLSVPDEAYDATAWNGSLEVPTKNAVRDVIAAGLAVVLPSFTTLTDGATITWTVTPNAINHASVTLGGNRTLAFSGSAAGTRGTLVVYQDSTGSRTLTLPSGSLVQGNGGGVILLSTAANSVDVLEFVHFGTNYLWSIGNKFN